MLLSSVRRHHGALRDLSRYLSTTRDVLETGGTVLKRWLEGWQLATPPVPPSEAPTALSWLRRRGPALPEALLHRLVRQESLRMYDPGTGKVRRVPRGEAPLPAGVRLLLPRQLVPDATETATAAPAARAARAASPAQLRTRQRWLEQLRGAVVHSDADLLAINKPAGLAVQGGSGLAVSVDSLMREAYGDRYCPGDGGAGLRLVHRLDRDTSGLLLLAKHPDAAAWLGDAFRRGAEAAPGLQDSRSSSGGVGSSRGRRGRDCSSSGGGRAAAVGGGRRGEATVQKTYWAVVDCSSSSSGCHSHTGSAAALALRPSQTFRSIDLPVAARSGSGASNAGELAPAHTRWRALARSDGLAWLELEPLTGRKHQLRLHCAQGLSAAILGDGNYAPVRSSRVQQEVLRELAGALVQEGGCGPRRLPLFLHCRSLLVRRPGGRGEGLLLTADLPPVWQRLFQQRGWAYRE